MNEWNICCVINDSEIKTRQGFLMHIFFFIRINLKKWWKTISLLEKIFHSFWFNRCTVFHLIQKDLVQALIVLQQFFHRILMVGIRFCSQKRWSFYPSRSLLFLPLICMLAYQCTFLQQYLKYCLTKNWRHLLNSNLVDHQGRKDPGDFLSAKRKKMGLRSLN